jgi:hypothetical protein
VEVLGMSLLDPANRLLISAKFKLSPAAGSFSAQVGISGASPVAFQREPINETALPYKK